MECPNVDLSAFTDSLDAKIAAEEAKATETQTKPKTYTVRGLADIARLKVEPMEFIWNEMPMVRGGLIEVIGAPGVGKSRFLSSLAKAQILGRQFGGLNTLENPKKWLFVGSENGIHRIQREAQKFILGSYRGDISLWTADDFYAAAERNGLSREEVDRLNVNFQTFTLEDPEDCLIVLNEENCVKLTATLVDRKPDILVCDPWGDLINGDELSDADIRGTVRANYAALTVKYAELIVMALTGTAPGTKPLMSELVVEYWERGYPKAAYVGTPEQIARIKALSEARKKNPVSQFAENGN